jgi:hypothetical protein
MPQVQLTDRLYQEAERRARDAGFASVDEFVADQLKGNFCDEQDNFDDRFTPALLAHLDRISADMQAGKKVSPEEVHTHLVEVQEEWRREHKR